MGREAEGQAVWRGETGAVKAVLESDALILRGEADPNLPDPGTGRPWATLAEERPDP